MALEYRRIVYFRDRLIKWYNKEGDQDLPWRRTNDPWAVLVAALMLRKTTTRQVIRVYEEFMKRFPKPDLLLNSRVEEVENLTRPLGIEHQRAIHLIEIASYIVRNFGGVIPCSREKLKELKGVGDYTASEVLLVACNQPEPLLDRNMIRVLGRVLGLKSSRSRPHTDPQLWKIARDIVPTNPQEARAFNYGVLDLARKICKASRPRCFACPLMDICAYTNKRLTS